MLQQSQQLVISTAFGISKESYRHRRGILLQGAGQGNGAAPAVWAVISAVVVNMMQTAGRGPHVVSFLLRTLTSFVCCVFVDDMDVVHASPSSLSAGKEVLVDMQTVVDRWEGGVCAAGGASAPSNCHWCLIDFVWWTGTNWQQCSLSPTSPHQGGSSHSQSDMLARVPLLPNLRLASVMQQGLHCVCTSTCTLFGQDRPTPPL
jgi:hypothetical protein